MSLPGHYYLLTTVTLKRKPLFKDLFAGRCLVRELNAADARTLAFVVMPDHVHWLIELRSTPLPRIMQAMKSRSAIAINKLLHRTGAVWQDGYHDHALRRDEGVRAAARYTVANPLRVRLADDIGDYPLWDAIWLY
jgi:REP element-mobilizing transposase RayT